MAEHPDRGSAPAKQSLWASGRMGHDGLLVRSNCPGSLRRVGYCRLRPPSFYLEDVRSRRFRHVNSPVLVMMNIVPVILVMLPGFGGRHEKQASKDDAGDAQHVVLLSVIWGFTECNFYNIALLEINSGFEQVAKHVLILRLRRGFDGQK